MGAALGLTKRTRRLPADQVEISPCPSRVSRPAPRAAEPNGSRWQARAMPTMDDVARESGFSQMTVSRAFLESASIKKETRERILKVAEEIGYYHNKAASYLASQRFARLRHHPPDAAGLDLPALRRGRAARVREPSRRLHPADHRLCPRPRAVCDPLAAVAARAGDHAPLDRAHARTPASSWRRCRSR